MKRIFTLLFLLILSYQVYSQPVFVTDSLDSYVQRALDKYDIPGVAVCVIKDGKIEVMKSYGVKELGTNDKVNENTLFLIGSNTKAFTGTALALMENEKLCSLDDKVIKYLPDFKMKDEWVTKELNLIDIVSHRMGMETFQGDFMYWTSDLTSEEVIEKFGKLTPNYGFRTKWGYTNAGYAIAGKVIYSITGLTWEQYLKEKIFTPLKMNRTVALSSEFYNAENITKAHSYVDGKISVIPFQSFDNLAPCGAVGSSIIDMSHWLIAQLDSGRYDGEQVIPYSVLQRTRQPQSIEGRSRHPYNKTHFTLYGLGWELQDYEGRELVQHTGGVNGFVTSVTLVPEEKLGVVVLTNTDQNPFFVSLKWEIIDAYLGLPYRNYDSTFFESFNRRNLNREKWIKDMLDSVSMNLTSSVDLGKLAGRYENEVYGYIDISRKENILEMNFEHHSKLKGKLEFINENRFLCTYSDPTYGVKVIPFEIENGVVKSLTLSVDDFIEFTKYEFKKVHH